jgi:hypothetical protein
MATPENLTPDFQDSKIPSSPDSPTTVPGITKIPPPNYMVLRAGQTAPETFRADSDEEAMTVLKRQVRSGQTAIVYIYKLMCAEIFVASSETLGLEQIKDRPVPFDKDQLVSGPLSTF